jgi:hypothetical protein
MIMGNVLVQNRGSFYCNVRKDSTFQGVGLIKRALLYYSGQNSII